MGPVRFAYVFLTTLFQRFQNFHIGLLRLSNVYHTLLNVKRSSKKTTVVTIPIYHGNSNKKLHIKIPRKVLLKPWIFPAC